ncbi:MAG: histidine phosphatase family protein [Candidatus Woesearchaeota archaeon]|jgi:broad specificity phosphatase PhoE|nr:histidine phosphatase family protein [Candidatus Woesearchaeota archaeon]MDP7324013.1 histidine phosphatase family protein [Candidatus Woesearchaeota archaeon]MDP7457483.1 histidine phosphatase family protein [Candidatus Woesearchaeota archaeon]
MRIYLIRHGPPKIVQGEYYHSHLSKEGELQTKKLAKSGKIPKPDRIYTSPYNRAIDTARIFSDQFNVDFVVKDCLKEWNLQSLNLQEEYDEEERKGWEDHSVKVLGNESLDDVKKRIMACVQQLIEDNQDADTLLLVSHGTIIDMFCTKIADRAPVIADIKKSTHLDYTIVTFNSGKFILSKEIQN